jgi:two-component system phosphate regulon response regulator PhoB
MQVNGLKLDLEFKRCLINENEVKMTRKEFELLVFLITHRGKICSREEILSKVWKDEVVILDRTIDVNIRRLRSKIGTYSESIVTRCGYGYGFRE